ncbi:hypothetical protein, partial [Mesorhizobium sp.]|uniref:hypothetical protein n=1 Tax=Mesorhizobium sp. TaxID=1871066 RepID=UPI0025CE69AB
MLPEPQLNAAFMPQSVSAAQGMPQKVYRYSGQVGVEDGREATKLVGSENRSGAYLKYVLGWTAPDGITMCQNEV